jgi:hypothetical protein
MPIRWSISQPQTDEHRVWVQCSHLTVSVSLWVLTLGHGTGWLPLFTACLEVVFSETGLPVLDVALILLPTVTHP